ncbi:NUDIX domain-containing protein [Nocardiopsis changdeensis]|uniref:NUDIX hydrolase n=1 Tax=Nocardiopsis changdeensis TaxID=2831969 RepID=A0ABX8BXN6_9ACTN|nr:MULTISPECIES: NUDIX hydrolase [Nocardiopsis]QUX25573.1 NUDIX hydrolase [Nocardiopsis changdeensis]QYX35959.1 NUDIX hydrolase [Nocardiopsis sp. MT53]
MGDDSAADEAAERRFFAGLPATRGAAGALILSPAGEVLLVERTYRPDSPWGLPGGVVERDESPLAACRRELAEELGVAAAVRRLVAVDWVAAEGVRTTALHWLFTAELPGGARLRLPPEELSGWMWADPGRVGGLLAPNTARRVAAGLAAAAAGETVYLENGHPVLGP